MKNSGTLKVTTPTDRQIVMTRVFNAPRRLVYEAMSKPELLNRWLFGPPGWSMVTCDDDLRVGGAFRWTWRGPGGEEMTIHGTYREVAPPQRVVRTEIMEFGNSQVGEQLASMVFTEEGDKTMLTLTLDYASKEARDGAIASGMEHGVATSYDRLADLLAESSKRK